jgi:hypothetical protein
MVPDETEVVPHKDESSVINAVLYCVTVTIEGDDPAAPG